jgi:hypothetical protein
MVLFYNTGHVLILPPPELGKGPPPKARVSVSRDYPQATTTKKSEPENKVRVKETSFS